MKKWMGLFLVVVLVLTSVMALADAPYLNKGGRGPYNAGILPEVKEQIINGNKEYQDAYNVRYAAGIEARQKIKAAGAYAFELDALLATFEVNRSNYGFFYQDLLSPKQTGISFNTKGSWSTHYIFTRGNSVDWIYVKGNDGAYHWIWTGDITQW